jgi:alpha-mannosidase
VTSYQRPALLALSLLILPRLYAADVEQQVLIIPHTHWEGAVFKTREEYLQMGLPHIVKALYLLKKYPDYRFVLDQMCYVRPFIERYPALLPEFREFLTQGRLQIAGGTDTMHDNNIPSGESIVRQYLYGKTYFRDKLGYDVTTGWGLDTFGHNSQMPQILKLAGMKSYWFQRGVPGIDTPSEFSWEGIDGTKVPAFWLPNSYAVLHNISRSPAEFARTVTAQYDRLTPFSRGHERVMMAGADVWEPEEQLPVAVAEANRSGGLPFRLRIGLPSDFERLVSARTGIPVIAGELNPVFQGIYSSRIDVKQSMREAERLLTTAEKFSVIADGLGAKADSKDIERAWEPVLFNQAHDLSSGVMVDKVYEDSMYGYNYARRSAEEIIRTRLEAIASRINTTGQGVPVAVFNTLGWKRTDVVEVDVAFAGGAIERFALVDPAGQAVPVQSLAVERNDDGGLRQARIAFVARDIPAMGYAIYHAVPNMKAPAAPTAPSHVTSYEDRGTIENQFYRASFDLWNGDMTSLVLKENNWEVLSKPGNVVAREYDGGDFWELYGTLNGGRFTAMKKEIPAPRPAMTQWSSDFVGGSGGARSGPVFSEFRISHPFGKNQFATRVRMYNGLRRIDISTDIVNQEEFVRYRAVFPTTIRNGRATHEIPFGAVERPERQEFPAQNWIDYSDGSKGLTLINRGLPGNNVADGTLMLSLLRSARLISYGYSGGYEPGVGSDSGLMIGKRLVHEYAIVPHTGGWRDAKPWRDGMEFNNPLIGRMLEPHGGEMPKSWGMIDVSADTVVTSALKPGRDGSVVLRLYEAAGKPATGVRVNITAGIEQAHEVNLIEDVGSAIKTDGRGFTFDLRPYEIKTFAIRTKPTAAPQRASRQ